MKQLYTVIMMLSSDNDIIMKGRRQKRPAEKFRILLRIEVSLVLPLVRAQVRLLRRGLLGRMRKRKMGVRLVMMMMLTGWEGVIGLPREISRGERRGAVDRCGRGGQSGAGLCGWWCGVVV